MAKSMITYILNDETLRSLSNHADKDAVNKTYWYHVDHNCDTLTKTERSILKTLTHYMVKFAGVAYTSRATLANAVGCSVKTVQRAYNKFSKLGIIEIIAAKRQSDMRQTANILRLVPAPVAVADEPETPVDPQDVPQGNGENVPALNCSPAPKVIKDLKTFESAGARECANNSGDESVVSPQQVLNSFNVPVEIQRALMPLTLPVDKILTLVNPNDTRNIVNHVQNVLMAEYPRVAACFELEEYVDVIQSAAIRTAWVAKRKKVRSLTGYFLKTLVTLLRDIFAHITAEAVADIVVDDLGAVAYESIDSPYPYFKNYVAEVVEPWVGEALVHKTVNDVMSALKSDGVPYGAVEGA